MTQSILRTVLTTLALVLLFAGSFNLNRTSAQEMVIDDNLCNELGCPGGPLVCANVDYPDGTTITCGMK